MDEWGQELKQSIKKLVGGKMNRDSAAVEPAKMSGENKR